MREILGVKYYTIKETSELLGIGTRTIQQYIYDEKLKGSVIIGRRWQIPEQSIKDYVSPKKGRPSKQ